MKREIMYGLTTAALTVAPAMAQSSFEMKLASNTMRDPVHEYLGEFKTRIEAKTNGRIKATAYPGSQLGTIPRMIEGTQLGTIEFFTSASGFFKGVNPAFQAFDVPGLFADLEHTQKTLSDPEINRRFLGLAEDKGLIGISMYVYSPTAYISRAKPLRRIDDFKGLKFRVLATKIETGVMDAVGAHGVPIPLEEVLPALQQGVIDGVRSSIVVTAGLKYFSVAKYITTVDDTMIPTIAFVSSAFAQKLPADLKATVLAVGKDMSQYGYEQAVAFNKQAAQTWRDNGAEVIDLSPADQAEFMRRAAKVGEEQLKDNPDKTTRELYALLVQTAEKYRRK